jgi:hypothetical protein
MQLFSVASCHGEGREGVAENLKIGPNILEKSTKNGIVIMLSDFHTETKYYPMSTPYGPQKTYVYFFALVFAEKNRPFRNKKKTFW